jgi:hypothetical protein
MMLSLLPTVSLGMLSVCEEQAKPTTQGNANQETFRMGASVKIKGELGRSLGSSSRSRGETLHEESSVREVRMHVRVLFFVTKTDTESAIFLPPAALEAHRRRFSTALFKPICASARACRGPPRRASSIP